MPLLLEHLGMYYHLFVPTFRFFAGFGIHFYQFPNFNTYKAINMFNLQNGIGKIRIDTTNKALFHYILLEFSNKCVSHYVVGDVHSCGGGLEAEIDVNYLKAGTYTVRAYLQDSPTSTITANANFIKQFSVKISHE